MANREIKFRGKRIDNGEWVYGYFYIHEGRTKKENTHRIIRPDYSDGSSQHAVEVFPESVGEYIGQNADNDKEYYEGDLISNGFNSWVIENKFGCFLMKWLSGDQKPPNGFILSYDFNIEGYEVFGNIYEDKIITPSTIASK